MQACHLLQKWMDLGDIMLCKLNQIEKDKYYMILPIYKTKKMK